MERLRDSPVQPIAFEDFEVEESQQALLAELPSGLHKGTLPSELVQDILARLRQDRPLPEEPRAVLLDGHPKDEKVLDEVEDFLRGHALLPNQAGPLEAKTFAPLFEKLGIGSAT